MRRRPYLLAQVQSEIEKAGSSQAQLRRRVATELLTVAMHERAGAGQAGKVKQAIDDFGWRRLRAGRRRS